MAAIVQPTPVGFLLETDDGSQLNLPEHIARQQFPEAFPAEVQSYPDQVNGAFATPPLQPVQPTEAPADLGAPTGPAPVPVAPPVVQTPPEPVQAVPAVPSASPPRTQAAKGLSLTDTGKYTSDAYDVLLPEQERINQAGVEIAGQTAADDKAEYDRQAELYAGQAEAAKADQEFVANLQAESAAKLAEKQADIDQARAEVGAVNSNRVWENMDEMGHVALAVAMFFGNRSAGVGGPNLAADWIAKKVEQDVREQEFNIQKQERGIAGLERDYDRIGSFYSNRLAWQKEQTALRLDTVSNELLKSAATRKSKFTQQEYAKAALAMKAEANKAAQEAVGLTAKQYEADNKLKLDAWQTKQSVGLGYSQLAEQKRKNRADEALDRTKLGIEAGKANAPKPVYSVSRAGGIVAKDPKTGQTGAAQFLDKDKEKELKDIANEYSGQWQELSWLSDFYKTNPSSVSPEDGMRAQAAITRYLKSSGAKFAASTEEDVNRQIAQAGGDPTKLRNVLQTMEAAGVTINDTRASLQSSYRRRVRQVAEKDDAGRPLDVDLNQIDISDDYKFRARPDAAAVYQDPVKSATEELGASFKKGPGQTVEPTDALRTRAVEKVVDTVVNSGDAYSAESDLAVIDAQIAQLAELPVKDRMIQVLDGVKPRRVDALVQLKATRGLVETRLKAQQGGLYRGYTDDLEESRQRKNPELYTPLFDKVGK